MTIDYPVLNPVGTTARLTAAARAVETRRPDRLFHDPYAATLRACAASPAALAGPEGFALMDPVPLTEMGAPWLSGSDEPEEVLGAAGWRPERVVQPGEPGADFRALPSLTVPGDHDTNGFLRLFFATASTP